MLEQSTPGVADVFLRCRKFLAQPHVVLIAISDILRGAKSCGLYEICAIAQTPLIDEQTHRERGSLRKALQNLQRSVAGQIVADDQFGRQTRLRRKTLELLFEKSFP